VDIDFAHLLRVRLFVARFGEMDLSQWWNTRGVLGQIGEKALSRGFPKTHFFAQARIVFAVAAERCRDIFDPPQAVTLWNLNAETEDRFDSEWSRWIGQSSDWVSFFAELSTLKSDDLLEEAKRLRIADDSLILEAKQLRRTAENRAVPIPVQAGLNTRAITLLGLGFFRGERSSPAIPYMKLGD
jgi:hypothetical protein